MDAGPPTIARSLSRGSSALTAQALAEQIAICRQAGTGSHGSKPFTQAALLDAVAVASELRAANSSVRVQNNIAAEVPLFDRAAFQDSIACSAPQVVAGTPRP
jgi:hypothetical protein